MPFLTRPPGSPAPSVADFAGMPMEAVEGAVAPALKGLVDAVGPSVEAAGRGVADGIFSPVSKAIQALRGVNAEAGAGEPLAHLGQAMKPAQPYASVTRMPKPGGVLSSVLERAGELQGAGQDVPPGSARLLQHYSNLIRK